MRHADASTWDLRELLRPNPRDGSVSGRAGLSWTGIRDYMTPSGRLRVLRRPSQVEAAGHLRTLRRLGTTEGHPSEDRDLGPDNFDELFCGYTGDAITVESLDGYARPVADFTVVKPSVFCKMMSADQWTDYAKRFPAFARGVERPSGQARTGTSLGYNALWMQPFVESEFVSDDDGVVVAAWTGPDGKTYEYDAEHVVDPDCEIVKRLEREQGFDPLTLGGQHFAIALPALTGRGGQQSELMRIHDAQWIGADPAHGRVTFQVPRAIRTTDMEWTVGASRDLPLEEGNRPWDGAAAAESIFAGAGWPDNPDPSAAKLGFLFYDASAPELKSSYKDPIARRGEDGRLRVPKSGLDAVASAIPKTDVPQDVRDRGRAVVEHYQAMFERARPSRDAYPGATMNKRSILIGIRDTATVSVLKALNFDIPTIVKATLDELPAGEIESAIMQMQELINALASKLKASKESEDMMHEKVNGMEKQLADMPTVEEAQKALEEAQKMLEAAKAAEAEAKKTSDSLAAKIVESDEKVKLLTATVDALNAELVPVREAQLEDFRKQLVAAGLDADKARDCADKASLRRAFVVARVSDEYAKVSDDKKYVHDDASILQTFNGAWGVLQPTSDQGAESSKPRNEYVPGPGLRAVPSPTIPQSTQDKKDDEQSSTELSSAVLFEAAL